MIWDEDVWGEIGIHVRSKETCTVSWIEMQIAEKWTIWDGWLVSCNRLSYCWCRNAQDLQDNGGTSSDASELLEAGSLLWICLSICKMEIRIIINTLIWHAKWVEKIMANLKILVFKEIWQDYLLGTAERFIRYSIFVSITITYFFQLLPARFRFIAIAFRRDRDRMHRMDDGVYKMMVWFT